VQRARGHERALALDEKTGKILWIREWPADYAKAKVMAYAEGPAATPTVDGNRIYVVGRTGTLHALDARTGDILWTKEYAKDFQADLDPWGVGSAPIVDGPRLIALVGGANNAKVVAFDKMTGKEIWRALSSKSSAGVSQPIILTAGGARQLIIWHPEAVVSLDPATGKVYWEQPFKVTSDMSIPMVHSGSQLLVSEFYNGSLMLALHDKKPDARVLWKGKSSSEVDTDGLHATIGTPVIQGDYIYGVCSYGQLRCLRAKTGERVWETQAVTVEKARWASAQIVRHGDRYFINNDRGELIIARFTPEGYQEISRTNLLKPTTDPRNRRRLVYVNWSHPAYANRHIYARNDEEIICASLAADDYK